MFYIEGTVDSIELEVDGLKLKRFSIVPTSQFMITLPDGKSRVLFVDYENKDAAFLVKAEKNGKDKEVVFFEVQIVCTSAALVNLLNQVKNNRSTIRVCVRPEKNEQGNVIPSPNLRDVFEFHQV